MSVTTLLLAGLLVMAGCTTADQRRAAEREAIQRKAADEVDRICALPKAEREEEIRKIQEESGLVLACADP